MPCKKCKDDKYKWGNTGECKYATKDECEKANPKKYSKMKNRPTPLGKKSYEEYAKELKEFNLSAEPKLEKVELGILQDGEKAVTRVKNTIKKAQGQISDVITFTGRVEKVLSDIEDLSKEKERLIKSYDNAFTALGEEKRDLFASSDELRMAVSDLSKIANELEQVQKDMGISVPGLSEFKKIAAQGKAFEKTIDKAYNKAKVGKRPKI